MEVWVLVAEVALGWVALLVVGFSSICIIPQVPSTIVLVYTVRITRTWVQLGHLWTKKPVPFPKKGAVGQKKF